MEIRYNVTGTERKRLVNAIADTLEVKAKYLGAPSMAYEVDTYTVGRDGTLLLLRTAGCSRWAESCAQPASCKLSPRS